ncbi:hypothetical protein [uncultured Mitsuokella sp.]|uniref:hypothetical protein n=1 Tax=uncultured Mitsuokella sp. TaxID=453120 RepID=UPI002605A3B1|nr:hypothetical protein [uncultured Mitsuokella sp.]
MSFHNDKIAYFFIAFALYLLIRAFAESSSGSLTIILLYVSIAISLLASNVPRVMDIPLHCVYPVRCVEIFSFGLAIVCFIVLCMHYIFILG